MYKQYLPKEIRVRLGHKLTIGNKNFLDKSSNFPLVYNEVLEFVKVEGNDIYYSNNRIRNTGIPYVSIISFNTDILYQTREKVFKRIYKSTKDYFDIGKTKIQKGKTIKIFDFNEDLSQRNVVQIAHVESENHNINTRRFLTDSSHVLPKSYTKTISEKEDFAEKYAFATPYSFVTELLNKLPDEENGMDVVLNFQHDGVYQQVKRKSFGIQIRGVLKPKNPVEIKSLKYEWDVFVDLTKDWKFIEHKSIKKNTFKIIEGNILFFRWKEVMDTTKLKIRLRRIVQNPKLEESKIAKEINIRSEKPKFNIGYLKDLKEKEGIDKYERAFETNRKKHKIYITDHCRLDGDIVSVYLNEKLIAKNFKIKKKKAFVEISLEEGENVIRVIAENLGKYRPNTAKVTIHDKSIILENEIGQSKSLLLVYKP